VFKYNIAQGNKGRFYSKSNQEKYKAKRYKPIFSKYRKAGKYEQALEQFQLGLQFNPRWAGFYRGRSNIFEILGKLEEAAIELERGLEVGDEFFLINFQLAEIYFKLGNLERSKQEFQKSIQLKPSFYQAYYPLIDIYLSEKRFSKANEYITQLKKMGGTVPPHLMNVDKKVFERH